MTQTIATQRGTQQASGKNADRPFHVNVPEADLTELRRRINATRWPDRETVADASQGVQLATTQALAKYWAKEYDWRSCRRLAACLVVSQWSVSFLAIPSKFISEKFTQNDGLVVGSARQRTDTGSRR